MIEMALIAQVLVLVLVTVVFLSSGSASMFHPLTLYLIFHALVFVMRPILVHTQNFDDVWLFMGFWPNEQQFVMTLVVSSVGLIAFAAACMWAGLIKPDWTPNGEPAPAFSFDRVDIVAFLTTALLLGPLGIY